MRPGVRPILLALSFVWTVCAPFRLATAQESGVRVAFQDTTLHEVQPGRVLTAVVRVTNTSAAPQHLYPSIALPAGWTSVFEEPPLTLGSNETSSRFLSLRIPDEALAGTYAVPYGLKDSLHSRAVAADTLSIRVRPKHLVMLDLLDMPAYVAAGRPFTTTLFVSNEGNVPEELTLVVNPEEGLTSSLDSLRLTLEPFSSERIAIAIETPPVLALKRRYGLRIAGHTSDGQTVQAGEAVDVIPPRASLGEEKRWLPLYASAWAINDAGALYPQFELRGETENLLRDQDHVQLLFRGPNQLRGSALGEIDTYWLQYGAPTYELNVGDYYYSLSPLTETGIRGFGARGDATLGKWTLGGYAHQTRYYSPAEQQYGAAVRYRLRDDLTLGTNYLGKVGRLQGQLLTVRTEFQPVENVRVDAEAGADMAAAQHNKAALLNVAGRFDRLGFHGRFFRVGDNFASNLRSAKFSSSSLSYQLTRRVSLNASYHEQWRNSFRNPLFRLAQRNRYFRAGARFGGYASLFYDYRAFFQNGESEWRDEALHVDLRTALYRFTPFARIQLGQRTYAGLDPFTFLQYDLGLQFRSTGGQSLQAAFSHDLDRNASTGQEEQRFGINLAGRVQIGRRLTASLFAIHNWYQAQASRFSNVDLALSYTLPGDHEIALRGRLLHYGPSSLGLEHAVSLRYVMPLRVPFGRTSSRGAVRGRVYDLDTGRGLENVLLYMGDTAAMTDANGRYAFVGLPPDAYFLQVERSSLDVDQTTTRSLPVQVVLEGGRSLQYDLGVTEAASLTGQVIRYTFEQGEPYLGGGPSRTVPAGGQRGLIIEVRNGQENQRRMTDTQGRFTFNHLRPGTWSVQVVQGNLPESHYLEQDSLVVELAPEDRKQIELNVLPRQRKVQMVGGGALELARAKVQNPPSGQAAPQQPPVRREIPQAPDDPPNELVEEAQGAGEHTFREADIGLMNLARRYYGDPFLWPKIWLANKAWISNPDRIPAGIHLIIPPKAPLTPAEDALLRAYASRRAAQSRIEEENRSAGSDWLDVATDAAPPAVVYRRSAFYLRPDVRQVFTSYRLGYAFFVRYSPLLLAGRPE